VAKNYICSFIARVTRMFIKSRAKLNFSQPPHQKNTKYGAICNYM